MVAASVMAELTEALTLMDGLRSLEACLPSDIHPRNEEVLSDAEP
jgi:hypothetical protein